MKLNFFYSSRHKGLQADGIVTIGGLLTLSYSYDTAKGNHNFRSIQGFSIDSSDLFLDCQRCPLATHQKFVTYYGDFSYADDFIQAALDGRKTNFDRGNVNFTNVGFAGRGGEYCQPFHAIICTPGTKCSLLYRFLQRQFKDLPFT
jgi:hypothetical protein